MMQALRELAAGFDGMFRQQRADQFLIAFLAGTENLNRNKLGMEFLVLDEAAAGVPDERNTPRHTCAEVSSRWAKHEHRAAGHVFASVITDAFDYRDGSGITNCKTFARAAD